MRKKEADENITLQQKCNVQTVVVSATDNEYDLKNPLYYNASTVTSSCFLTPLSVCVTVQAA